MLQISDVRIYRNKNNVSNFDRAICDIDIALAIWYWYCISDCNA